MNPFGLIPLAVFLINGFTMTYVYARRKRSGITRAYFILTAAIGLWLALDIILHAPVPHDLIVPLLKIKSVFWLLTGLLFLNFTMVFTDTKRGPDFYITAVLCTATVAVSLATPLMIAGYRRYGWGITEEPGALFLYGVFLVVALPIVYAVSLIVRKGSGSDDGKYRGQLALLVTGSSLSLAVGFCTDYLLPHLFHFETPRFSASPSVFLSIFVFIAVIRYRFLAMDIEDLAPELFDFFNEGAVVTGPGGGVTSINRAARELLGLSADERWLPEATMLPVQITREGTFPREVVLDTPKGARRLAVSVHKISGHESDGGSIIILRDITRQHLTEDARLRGELLLLDVFSSIKDGLCVMDRDLRIMRANPTAELWAAAHMPLVGKKCHDVFPVEGTQCRNCPGMQTLLSGASSYAVVPWKEENGGGRWLEIYSFPLFESQTGDVRGVIEYMRDISPRVEYERRMARINETFLGFTTDPLANINSLTSLCGELLDASCALYNRLERDLLHSLGRWRTPPGYDPVSGPEGRLCYDVILAAGGGPLVVRNLPDTPYARTDPIVRALGLQCCLGIKVRVCGEVVGSLCAVFQKDYEPSGDDIRLMEIIAAAIGIEEERMRTGEALRESEESLRQRNEILEKDLMLARHIQRELVPRKLPEHSRILMDWRYLPLESVGGDFFSFFRQDDGDLAVFVGDVANHGVSAALFVSLVKATTDRIFGIHSRSPEAFLLRMNEELMNYMPLSFLTAVYGCFNTAAGGMRFTFASAGHPDPIVCEKKSGRVHIVDSRGPLLGQFKDIEFEERTIELGGGDRIYLYTDGLPETANRENRVFGYENLVEAVDRSRKLGLRESMDYVLEETTSYRNGAPPRDDIILLGFEVLP